ncbi:MAG: AAA family ATPase [Kineosporiaceae bacterium]
MTVICDLDPVVAEALGSAVGEAVVVTGVDALRKQLEEDPAEDTVVLGPTVDQNTAFRLAEQMRIWRPALFVILVRQRVDAGLLAESLRAGVFDVIDQRNISGLHNAVRRSEELAAKMRDQMREQSPSDTPPGRPKGRIITVFSAKGGCGKTTLATNMAAALADRGRREVCLVDLDLAFGDVAIALQLFPAHTIADAVPLGDNVDFGSLQTLLTPHSPGLTTLVAPVEPGTSEGIPATLVSRILEVLRAHFDFVIVDTPPAFDDHVLTAFDLSDVVALLATLDIPALKNLKLTLETMDLLNYPRDRWRIVLNRADSKVGLAIGEVEKSLRTPIAAQIPSSRDVPAAINRGVPIVLDDPRHPVSVAIKSFAERFVVKAQSGGQERPATGEVRAERRGLLRRRSRA